MNKIPVSLYIHLPWCIRKCPYCDFNSHAIKGEIPEKDYIKRLIDDFNQQYPKIRGRQITSIFFGGGTPSLFSAESINTLLSTLFAKGCFSKSCEITLEANPGTVEQKRFKGFYEAGINRISLGVQSFQNEKLTALGRIHNSDEAKKAIDAITCAGFTNFNIDIMHGLPHQTINDALYDLHTALDCHPAHLSWYQLTIEPNTVFYKHKPHIPSDDVLADIEEQGIALLAQYGFERYEVSAYAKKDSVIPTKAGIFKNQCQHNLNYWLFGDYLGIGAGAHSKLTNLSTMEITRHWQMRQPKDYLDPQKKMTVKEQPLDQSEKIVEFMMNALRLHQVIPYSTFEERTGLSIKNIEPILEKAKTAGLLAEASHIETTPLGKLFLNDLVNLFN